MFNNFPTPTPENHSVYEIMWKHTRIVEPGRPQMTLWRMRIACSIPKATITYSDYVILAAFPLQQWLDERTTLLCYNTLLVLLHSTFSMLLASVNIIDE